QRDLCARAHVRQQDVSNIERARLQDVRVSTVRRVTAALGATAWFDLRWRGGMLDRLLDERHADLVERASAVLIACGWKVRPELSFRQGVEHGSIDTFAWHEASRTVLVIEIKTELTSIEETLRRLDVKTRLAPDIARELLGWRPQQVATLLVVGE